MTTLVGVISDTHNLVRPQALSALKRSVLILHAGDVCRPEVLEELEKIAPVVAVRGNNDRGSWARSLPISRTLDVSGRRIHVIHDLKELAIDPAAQKMDAVVSGHSHRPVVERREGVLYLNPGSAGPRRFKLPVAVARLMVGTSVLRVRIVELAI
ncbi:MAG TPA: metallophosphoesterase family protein [Vicinamibacteria bacterium]